MSFGPGFWPTFLYYFVSTTLITAFVSSKGLGVSLESGLPLRWGLILGAIAGIAGGYFNRTVTFSVEFNSRKKFLRNLNDVLAQMGYSQTSELEDSETEDDILIYQKSALGGLLSGKVFVQIGKGKAIFASRSVSSQKLRKRF